MMICYNKFNKNRNIFIIVIRFITSFYISNLFAYFNQGLLINISHCFFIALCQSILYN